MEKDFIRLITENQGIIHKVANLYSNGKEEKQDLFQEILLQLWKSYGTFQHKSKFTTWMYRVALNTALTSFRKFKKQKLQQDIDEIGFQIPDLNTNQEIEEQIKYLYAAISQLSEIERAIIMLYLEEHDYKEISQILGITESNVGVKINRIKKKLKTILSPMIKS